MRLLLFHLYGLLYGILCDLLNNLHGLLIFPGLSLGFDPHIESVPDIDEQDRIFDLKQAEDKSPDHNGPRGWELCVTVLDIDIVEQHHIQAYHHWQVRSCVVIVCHYFLRYVLALLEVVPFSYFLPDSVYVPQQTYDFLAVSLSGYLRHDIVLETTWDTLEKWMLGKVDIKLVLILISDHNFQKRVFKSSKEIFILLFFL